MIALVQRVREASVLVDGVVTGSIGPGLLILLGVHQNDGEEQLDWVVRKCASLRVFADESDKMNLSVRDVDGGVLVVSQFTLYGDTRKGNRPSYTASAPPDVAEPLYEQFISKMESALNKRVERGVFGAMMDVQLVNDGPVTLWVERQP